jgi:hypothetical protein
MNYGVALHYTNARATAKPSKLAEETGWQSVGLHRATLPWNTS